MKIAIMILSLLLLSACSTTGPSYSFEVKDNSGILQDHVIEADLSNSLVIVNPEVM